MDFLNKLNVLLITGGTISFSASSLTAVMIRRSHGGLLTPYRRIIFGLSVSDVIQSFAVVLGPFLIPKEYRNASSWGIGTIRTCELQGFLLTFGASSTCMYTLLLCVYYFCKIKMNMSGNKFRKRIEEKSHWIIFLLNFSVCVAALATKTYNPLPGAGTCHFVRNPFGCSTSIPGDCLRGRYAPFFVLLYYPAAVPCICISIVLCCLTTIVWHVVNQDRIFRTHETPRGGLGRGNSNGPIRHCTPEEIQVDRVARLLRRETILQVVLYVSAFFLTYGLPFVITVCNVTNTPVPNSIKCTTSAFFPLGGLFNILIYTRPQVVAFRRLHEGEYSWLRALVLVIKAGGENPDTVESPTSPLLCFCCCRRLCGRLGTKDDLESLPSQMRYPALRSLVGRYRKGHGHDCDREQDENLPWESPPPTDNVRLNSFPGSDHLHSSSDTRAANVDVTASRVKSEEAQLVGEEK